MRTALLTAGFVLSTLFATAQDKIIASSSAKGPVIEHKVSSGETLYGVARKYNTKAAEVASANGFDLSRSLKIGESLKIPLVASNFNQKDKKGTPVYYTVGDGEGLLSVSKKFNKVPLKTLKDWNGLKSDAAPKDKPLVVGYLSGVNLKPAAKEETAKVEEKVATKKDEKAAAKKEEKSKEVAKKETKPAKAEKKPEQVIEEKIVAKQETEDIAKVQEPVIDESGFYKTTFEKNTNPALLANRTLMSGVFKTDAGWSDRKYYMLMDGIAAGTIVKITNPQNAKVVYAKVLGNMKDVKYSEGLNLRISEAAAAVMQLNNLEQFVVNVNY